MNHLPLRVLIADDHPTDRMTLQSILVEEGHEVLLATNGRDALKMFWDYSPDLVLLDVLMPILDGMYVAKEIRRQRVDDYIPIIFLSAMHDAETLAKCLESGGDSFISKPYNRIVIQSKVKAFGRMRSLHLNVQKHNRRMMMEQHVAKTIFDKVAHAGSLALPNISHSLSPLSVFNGDTVLAARKPDGGMFLFVGDFTGHGLPAAIGAMPLADIFYGMTVKGFSMEDVLREINNRLHTILPIGVFCCGGFVELQFYEKKAKIWLGGLPDIVCHRKRDNSTDVLTSKNLPLGILDAKKFKTSIDEIYMENGDELFLWSDGLIEARNPSGEMYGENRLYNNFDNSSDKPLFDAILSSVGQFTGDHDSHDDLTLLSVKMVDIDELGFPDFESNRGTLIGPQDWDFSYCLRNATLAEFNPLPLVLTVINEVEGLRRMASQLYTIVSELFSNALEHGVLELPSSLKRPPNSFTDYYAEREKRLAALQTGTITLRITHSPVEQGGLLALTVEDSGRGFDFNQYLNVDVDHQEYSGRGIPLVQALCHRVQYQAPGNSVTAYVKWTDY